MGERTYGTVARTLHWLVFALVAAQFIVGWTMPEIETDTPQEGLVDWHLSIGATILAVVVLRLIWRIVRPMPLSAAMPVWERKLARATHDTLYLLLILLPLLGWAGAGYFGYTVNLFGVIPLPALAAKGTQWAEIAGEAHAVLQNVLLAVIGLHVVGALYHYFILRDRVMQRMLPGV
jgi:cytochrome b561